MADSADAHESTLHRDISRAMIRLTHEYTGRGPTRARTTINGTLVAIVLEDTLTKGEKTLVASGHADAVVDMRYRFQQAMRDAATSAIAQLTDRRVVAFLSANHIEPDLAAEIFILDQPLPDHTTG
jgi:uncharacterized protein YbcI